LGEKKKKRSLCSQPGRVISVSCGGKKGGGGFRPREGGKKGKKAAGKDTRCADQKKKGLGSTNWPNKEAAKRGNKTKKFARRKKTKRKKSQYF